MSNFWGRFFHVFGVKKNSVRTKKLNNKLHFFAPENMKKPPSKVAHNRPNFFQYCQPAQNQPKSHIRFHKNGSLRDFYIMIQKPITDV